MSHSCEIFVFSSRIINDVIQNEDKINLEKINFMRWTKESLENCAFILQHLPHNLSIEHKIRKIIKHYFLWLSTQNNKPEYLSQLSSEFLITLQNM